MATTTTPTKPVRCDGKPLEALCDKSPDNLDEDLQQFIVPDSDDDEEDEYEDNDDEHDDEDEEDGEDDGIAQIEENDDEDEITADAELSELVKEANRMCADGGSVITADGLRRSRRERKVPVTFIEEHWGKKERMLLMDGISEKELEDEYINAASDEDEGIQSDDDEEIDDEFDEDDTEDDEDDSILCDAEPAAKRAKTR